LIEGQKHGARTPISDSKLTSVGNDYDCDVMLGLPGIEHALALPGAENEQKKLPVDFPKLEMQQHEGRVFLKVVRGNIQVGQKTLSEGGQSELLPDTPVKLGNSVFVVGPTSALQKVESQLGSSPGSQLNSPLENLLDVSAVNDVATTDTGATDVAALTEQSEQPELESAEVKPEKRAAVMLKAVAVVCVVVGGIVAVLNYGKSADVPVPDASKAVAAELEQGGFAGLSVALLDNDAVLVNGFLESRAELYEARSLVQASTDASVEWEVQTGEALVESVQSVFQVNGVEKIAYDDVADLEHLELVNSVPVVAVEEAEQKNNSMDSIPGKRIVMISDDISRRIHKNRGWLRLLYRFGTAKWP